ncbi:MAG: RsmB/NOP family class I SAM-dependent RNA methyltransferase [Candidatus Latescibacteria bacterium]|nr:RsmB/NOP family class I SAM-dependent RNA methyltransferase [Candidatus Latescibacterota bacterium]
MNPPLPLPQKYLERLRLILPAGRLESCIESMGREPATTFRINPLKATATQAVEALVAEGFQLTPLSWKADAFSVPHHQRRALTESAPCREGWIYIQNPASMVPPLVLDPHPGEWVLDLAAAPGSKTLQLAAMMAGQGRLSAVEVGRDRFFRLKANLEAHGASWVQLYLKDGTGVGRTCPAWFDRVLLDAPCSGEGRINALYPETYAYWSEAKIRELSHKQKRLLSSAARALKPGGVLVYSTCSLAPEENELVVAQALEWGLEVEEIALPFAAQPGLTQWQGKTLPPQLARCLRILPDGLMEGFFVCRLRKPG